MRLKLNQNYVSAIQTLPYPWQTNILIMLPKAGADEIGLTTVTLFIKNGGRGTKPTYIFMVINPLLAIKLKATPYGNPTVLAVLGV